LQAVKDTARNTWGAYTSAIDRAAAPLRGRIPDSVLGLLPIILLALVFLLVLVIVMPGGGETEAAVASKKTNVGQQDAKEDEARKADQEKAGAEGETKQDGQKDPEGEKKLDPTELWKVAPDANLASCKEMLGESAPKAEAPERAVT
jgi:hypothetical protein